MSELDLDDVAATSPKAMAELAALRDLVRHLRHCRLCGEEDVTQCEEGNALWTAAMQATP